MESVSLMQTMQAYHGIAPYISTFVVIFIVTLVRKLRRTTTPAGFRYPPSPPALPIIGHLHLLRSVIMPKSFQNLARVYGPLMQLRLGASTCVVVSNAQVAREVMKIQELNFCDRPLGSYERRENTNKRGSSFISAPYGPYWKFMRKIFITRLLSSSQLNRLKHIREEEIEKLLKSLMECSHEGKEADLSVYLTTMANNIICRMAMSTSCLQDANEAEEILRLFKEFLDLAVKVSVGEILGPLGKLDFLGYEKKIMKVMEKFDQIVERIMKEHEDKYNNKGGYDHLQYKDMMDVMLEIYRDANAEVRLTRADIKSFFLDIFLAGTETSSEALKWGMAEIINHPQVFSRLRAEVDSVVGPRRLVKESDVPNLPYLQAVTKEILRLHPTAVFALRQSVKDCKVNGFDIKGGTRTLVNIYAIMRDPDSWANPEEFKPERFLSSNVHDEVNGQRSIETNGQDFTYVPFGSGRRVCPGAPLALAVLHTTIGTLIQCFDWKVKDGDKVDTEEGSGFSAGLARHIVCYPNTRLHPF